MYYLDYEIIYDCENGKKKKNHKQEAEHESIIVFEM